MAFLFMGLILVPCDDTMAAGDCESSYVEHSDQEDHKDTGDECSPLCICNCCQVHFTSFSQCEKATTIELITEIDFLYLESHPKESFNPLLKPPKF